MIGDIGEYIQHRMQQGVTIKTLQQKIPSNYDLSVRIYQVHCRGEHRSSKT